MTPDTSNRPADSFQERVERLHRLEVAADLADMVAAATGIDPVRLDVEVHDPAATGGPGLVIHQLWDADGTVWTHDTLDGLDAVDEMAAASTRSFCARFGPGDYDLPVDRTDIPLTAAASSEAERDGGQALAGHRVAPDAGTLTHAELVAHMTDQHRWGYDEPLDDVPTATILGLHADDHADNPDHTARTDHTHRNDSPPTLFDMADGAEVAHQTSPMDDMADDAHQRAALRQQQEAARIRRHDVEQAIGLHTGTILATVEATLEDAGLADVDWDGVNVMFELVDGHIPLVYVNVSAAIGDDETRDEIDTEIERDLNRHPDLAMLLGRLADDWGTDLADETVWLDRPDPEPDGDSRLLDDPATLTASGRRTLARALADLLGISRRAAYTLIDDGLPVDRLGSRTEQVATLLGNSTR